MAKAFDRVMELHPNTLMIVDCLNLAFRWKHAKSTEFAEDFLSVIKSLQKSYKAGKVILACDKGSSSYRKSIYPEYKQNRADKYANQTEEEKLEYEAFFKEFEKAIELASSVFPLIRMQGVEADDIAAYLVNKCSKLNTINNIWLMSSDKDWDLLISENVSRFSYVTRKETTFENWYEHYDCEPEQYISIKCLNGDSGDNIKGIDGIGPKRALDLVKTYGSAIELYNELPITSKYKYIQNLNSAKETILLNYKLMDLITFSEDAIGIENCKIIDKIIEEKIKETE